MIALERRDGRPLVIGHRGAAALAPENTLRSFRAALAAGVDLIEFDVLELKGGELVLAHSNDLAEVSHGAARGTVRDRTLAGLRDVAPELPTLDEALAFFAEEGESVGVHLDLKTPGAEQKVAGALDRFGLVERTLVSSFHVGSVRTLSRIDPRVRTGISFPEDRLGIYGRRGFGPVIRAGLRVLRPVTPALVGQLLARSCATVLALHHALVTPAAIRGAHDRGAAVVAWTIDDPRDLVRVETAGVDAVVVNDPGIFASKLET
ncbi:MAG TPA: glycerophosphodiester phosphodiesterase [Gaiellaceae bacterium]